MRERTNIINSIENINSININRENFSILKWIDEDSFDKLLKSFWNEKDENKVLISWFLNSTNIILAKLWDIKIGINHINNYVQNKPDISKDLERKIAKLYLKKLYELWATNIQFMAQIKNAFDIENKVDIENKNIDFKTIQIDIQKFWKEWNDKITSVAVSNEEIFDLLGNDIKKYANFQSQNVSSQQIILDLLNFEVKWVISHVKSWWKKAEEDMEDLVLPMNDISGIFDEISDPKIFQLEQEKENIQEQLFLRPWKDRTELERYAIYF